MFRPAIVLLDFNLPGMDGLAMLAEIRRRDPRIKVIMITGQGSEQVAVDAMKAGAYDYLTKPVVLEKLKLVLEKALGQERLEEELAYYRSKAASGSGVASLLGASAAMLSLRSTIQHILAAESVQTDADPAAVLITGETGTGKELVARALHFDGPRCKRPFVEFNCANIPLHLAEAKLFGYERGAFPDAKENKPGLIETAEGGSLFLDEIGDIDVLLQVKLLTLLESKQIEPLARPVSESTQSASESPLRDMMNLSQTEKRMLERALEEASWNITRAARLLGVSRDTLRYRIEKHGLSRSLPP